MLKVMLLFHHETIAVIIIILSLSNRVKLHSIQACIIPKVTRRIQVR